MVATVNLAGLEPDQIPQLMLFLLNSTDLGTTAVPITTTGKAFTRECSAALRMLDKPSGGLACT